MSSQQIFYQYVILLVLTLVFAMVILSFFRGRAKASLAPSRLRLKKSAANPFTLRPLSSQMTQDASDLISTKNLNVMFMYNGHEWDAYEVLGIPAGAGLEAVKKGFEQAANGTQKESHEFLRAALEAILKDHSKRS